MLSLFRRPLGRALCHSRPFSCRHPISAPHVRLLTSTHRPLSPRPYPHRRHYSPDHDHNPRFLSFLDRIPKEAVFWGIITINGVVFVMWALSSQRMRQDRNIGPYKWMLDNFTHSWRNFSEGRIWTPITAMFSHEGIGHILFNGFTFYFLSKPVLSALGSRHFLFLYVGGGLFSCLSSMLWNTAIRGKDTPAYGASGAIYSTVAFLACAAPTTTFMIYGIIPVPAWLAVAGIFTYDTYSTINDKQKGTDTAGHVGGLLGGILFYLARYRIR